MSPILRLAALVLLLALVPPAGAGGVHRCVDARGAIHFTDKPCVAEAAVERPLYTGVPPLSDDEARVEGGSVSVMPFKSGTVTASPLPRARIAPASRPSATPPASAPTPAPPKAAACPPGGCLKSGY